MSDRNYGDMQYDGLRITLFKYREKQGSIINIRLCI